MKTLQPIHTVVMTSPSPAEGKSLSATNLALAQVAFGGKHNPAADFDFRRPIVHTLFGVDRSPRHHRLSAGPRAAAQSMKKIAGTNLYIMPAGEAVINPLELLNLREVKHLLDRLPTLFNWIILDSPPLLFAADANLLSTLCHGTLLVVRIGHTTIDSVTRAMQSLCNTTCSGSWSTAPDAGSCTANTPTITRTTRRREEEEKKKIDEAHVQGAHEAAGLHSEQARWWKRSGKSIRQHNQRAGAPG